MRRVASISINVYSFFFNDAINLLGDGSRHTEYVGFALRTATFPSISALLINWDVFISLDNKHPNTFPNTWNDAYNEDPDYRDGSCLEFRTLFCDYALPIGNIKRFYDDAHFRRIWGFSGNAACREIGPKIESWFRQKLKFLNSTRLFYRATPTTMLLNLSFQRLVSMAKYRPIF